MIHKNVLTYETWNVYDDGLVLNLAVILLEAKSRKVLIFVDHLRSPILLFEQLVYRPRYVNVHRFLRAQVERSRASLLALV